MGDWNDAPQTLFSFVSALSTFDWEEVTRLTASLLQRLDQAEVPFPESTAIKILSGLRRKRRFRTAEELADGFILSGQRDPEIYRQYAQAMIDRGSLTGAAFILKAQLDDSKNSPEEKAEASGLLGRISKQLYVNARNPSSSRQQANLAEAIHRYHDVYRTNRAAFFWHGINVVALLERAARDSVPVDIGVTSTEIAQQLRSLLDKQDLNSWERATAVENSIALRDFGAAIEHTFLFVSDVGVDAFEVASLRRQLLEVWQLDVSSEPGQTILPLLQAALLSRDGGGITIDNAPDAAEHAGVAQQRLEKVFGQDRYQPLDWLKTALTRCSAVGRVETTTGRKVGTGFLVNARDFFPSRPENEVLFLTNSHVISPASNLFAGAIPPGAARVLFEESGKTIAVEQLVWSSPPDSLDATFVTLPGLEGQTEKCPLVPAPAPFDRNKQQRLYVIGYPLGGGLSFSLQDSIWLDADDRLLHYRTPTEPGSSGSPVFDQDYWTLVGLHHSGKKDMVHLNGTPGTYEANEAISIAAIQQATQTTAAAPI